MESSHAAIPDPEEVLEHLDWVRGLAVRLVGDPAEADDLRQEVWLLSQRVGRPGWMPLRGWLGGLLRNRMRDRRRAQRTREYHEQSVALERARDLAESPAVRGASLHHVVVARLLGLSEPYRSTLLARYFEDLDPVRIAERDGVPLATVRSRLQRGLNLLREDLGRKDGGRPSLLALLALRTWDPEVVGTIARRASEGAMAAGPAAAWSQVLLGVVLATGVALVLVRSGRDDRDAPLTPLASTAGEILRGETSPVADGRGGSERASVPMPEAPDDAGGDALPSRGVPVRVIDPNGAPVGGLEVAYLRVRPEGGWDPGPVARTDDDGRATVAGVSGQGMIGCRGPDHLVLATPNAGEEVPADRTLVVVVVRAAEVRGRVHDPLGEPISGVELRFDFLGTFPEVVARHLDHANHGEHVAHTDEEGRFALRLPHSDVPLGLLARCVGYQDERREGLHFGPEPTTLDLVLAPVADPDVAFGRVVGEGGAPVAGAWVADGTHCVRTDAEGRFQLGPLDADATLWVGGAGFAARSLARPTDLHGLELELSGAPLTLQGHVRFPDGTPAAGLELRLAEERMVGDHHFPYGGRIAFLPMSVEAFGMPDTGPVPQRPLARTAADGSFTFGGLLPRDYELVVYDPASLARVDGLRFSAGARGLEILFPELPPAVEGVLRDPAGQPLAGVLVRTLAPGATFRQGAQVRSDGEGRFRFQHLVPGAKVLADVELPWVHLGEEVRAGERLELALEPAARVRLTLDLRGPFAGGDRTPDRVRLRDAAGGELLFVVDDLLSYRKSLLDLRAEPDGFARPVPLIVPVRARELVLADDTGPVLVLPLDLRPGDDLHLEE